MIFIPPLGLTTISYVTLASYWTQGVTPTNKETRLTHRLVRAVGQFWSGSVPGGRVSPVVMDVIIVTSDIVTLIHSVYSADSHPHTDLHCQLFTIFQVSTGIAL